MGRPDDVIKTVTDIIDKTDNEKDAEVMAMAYNTLGAAYKKAGKNKEALMAYLHVDVIDLYAKCADAHAEALSNLVDFWTALGHPDRRQSPPYPRRKLQE